MDSKQGHFISYVENKEQLLQLFNQEISKKYLEDSQTLNGVIHHPINHKATKVTKRVLYLV